MKSVLVFSGDGIVSKYLSNALSTNGISVTLIHTLVRDTGQLVLKYKSNLIVEHDALCGLKNVQEYGEIISGYDVIILFVNEVSSSGSNCLASFVSSLVVAAKIYTLQ